MKSRCKIKIKRLLVLNVKIGHATSRSKIKKKVIGAVLVLLFALSR